MPYLVKSASVTFGSTTLEVASAPCGTSMTCDAVEVTSLGDTMKRFIPGSLSEYDDVKLTVYQAATDLTVNTIGSLNITVTITNGTTDQTVSVAYANAIVTKVTYPDQAADGDRKATYDVTFKIDGDVPASAI